MTTLLSRRLLGLTLVVASGPADLPATELVDLHLDPLTSIEGRSAQWDWWQARTAFLPGEHPRWITTMSETGREGTHNFHHIYQSRSTDGGRSWSAPEVVPSLRRVAQADGYEVAPADLWPTWHAKTGVVLATGKTFNFEAGKRENRWRERVAYAVFDPRSGEWGPLRTLAMPERDHGGREILAPNAGCTQRIDLPNGEILLPVRYWAGPEATNYTSVVVRCGFDGNKLTYLRHGSELTVPMGRGLYEPSLVRHRGWFYLTLRADHSAYHARSKDGLDFEQLAEWKFDDGSPLGSYNTQQHWLTAGGGLFLVYTRRGAGNDHVFRHRAPLFIAQIDPDRLRVIKASERILLLENGATLGNSGVCRIGDRESWVTCGEGLLRLGKRKAGRNKVHFVRVTAPE